MEFVGTGHPGRMISELLSSWWCIVLSWCLYAVVQIYGLVKAAPDTTAKKNAAPGRAAVKAAKEAEAAAEYEANRPLDPCVPAATPWRFSNVSIHTIEHVVPPRVVSTKETLERLGWRLRLAGVKTDILERMTGIKERRMWDKGTTGVQAATWAARKAIKSSGIDPNRIGVICNTSVWRDFLEPGMAVCIHHELGLPASCLNMDITNACVGMVNGMLLVANMIESGMCDYALVVDAEAAEEIYETTVNRLCRTMNPKDFRSQLATLTIGSGAAAAILCRSDLAPPGRNHRLTGAVQRCAPFCRNMCVGTYDKMTTDGKMLLHGGHLVKQTWAVATAELGWSSDNIDALVPHQVANKVHGIGAQATGVDMDKIATIYPYRGNVGPASLIIALCIALEENKIKEGMRVALVSFGSGLNCIMAEVIW